ncbi:hypothetical protein [Burkholderia pseudomallei]
MDATNNRIYREARPTNDGGPAFPVDDPFALEPHDVDEMKRLASGMSLRDFFAIKALVGLMTMPDEWRSYFRRDGAGTTWKAELANAAYEVADAMLRAREA